jgi:hypothetical protein
VDDRSGNRAFGDLAEDAGRIGHATTLRWLRPRRERTRR